jgi:hypothetical protein
MPAAAAVTTARFPFSRSDMFFFSFFLRHCEQLATKLQAILR